MLKQSESKFRNMRSLDLLEQAHSLEQMLEEQRIDLETADDWYNYENDCLALIAELKVKALAIEKGF